MPWYMDWNQLMSQTSGMGQTRRFWELLTILIGQERVELYLYSPYGPYGLYRASVHFTFFTFLCLFHYSM